MIDMFYNACMCGFDETLNDNTLIIVLYETLDGIKNTDNNII